VKICQLIDFVNVGGAGIAANRIADAMLAVEDVEICQISNHQRHGSKNITCLQNSRKMEILKFCSKYLRRSYLEKFVNYDICRQLEKILKREKPDIINVHNIHSAGWPIGLIRSCLKHSPVSWTLHDCWSFLGSYYPKHTPAAPKKLKRELDAFWEFQHPNLTATTPSKWMQEEAASSHWSNSKITVIHNPIPRNFFEYKKANTCKEALGLKTNIPTILVISGNINEERKGGGILKSILESNITDKAQFVLIGTGDSFQNENIKSIGFIRDEITIQIAYHAADILVHPAPVDNFPNTIAESISCGNPVLAFNVGGIPEMVIPEKSGWLINDIGATPMLDMLKNIISNESYRNLRKSTQEIGINLFDTKNIGHSYLNCYKEIISSK